MSKGDIVFFDDDPGQATQFGKLIKESGFRLILFEKVPDLAKHLNSAELPKATRFLVLDLAKDQLEVTAGKGYEIASLIAKYYDQWRVPIIVHSGHASTFTDYDNHATIWKIEKGDDSLVQVARLIDLLYDSGFVGLFGQGGELERNLMSELHKVFRQQFKNKQIEDTIVALKGDGSRWQSRVHSVLSRIALNAMYQEMTFSTTDSKASFVEMYYRRTGAQQVMTGDIFQNNNGEDLLFVLTPRCDFAHGSPQNILVCRVLKYELKVDDVERAVHSNPNLGPNMILLPSPAFRGGKVPLKEHLTFPVKELLRDYKYLITVAPDQTNEILGRFGAHFLRPGSEDIDEDELKAYISATKKPI